MTSPAAGLPPGLALETARLRLRPWKADDLDAYIALNAHPRTVAFFPHPIDAAMTAASLDRHLSRQAAEGTCFSVAERRDDGLFLGFVGLALMREAGPGLDGEWEIGWRLIPESHGQGYASEGARAWIAHAFGPMALSRVVAWTAATNLPSQAVMARIGMSHAPELDRDHPRIEPGNPTRRHVVWRITRPLQPDRI